MSEDEFFFCPRALSNVGRLYCIDMMLREVEKLPYIGETRRYLGLDRDDRQVVVEALEFYRMHVRDSVQ